MVRVLPRVLAQSHSPHHNQDHSPSRSRHIVR
jgi:hypothetical protein